MNSSKNKKITAAEFDRLFDENEEDIMEYLDLTTAKVRYPVQNFSISFPSNIVDELDDEAAKLGVTRTELIKSWVEERLANRKG